MIYLDEDIIARFTTLSWAYQNTFANYKVHIPDIPVEHSTFEGRVFISSDSYGHEPMVEIYLNDIIESLVKDYWDLDNILKEYTYVRKAIDFKLKFNVYITLFLNDGTFKTVQINNVCAVYRYPNENRPELPAILDNPMYNKDITYVVLDGFDYEKDTYALTPRIPRILATKPGISHKLKYDFDILTYNTSNNYYRMLLKNGDSTIKTMDTIIPYSQRQKIINGVDFQKEFMYEEQNGYDELDGIDKDADIYLGLTVNNCKKRYCVIYATGLQPNIQPQEGEDILFHEFGMSNEEVRDAIADILGGVPTLIYKTKHTLDETDDEDALEWQTKRGIASGYFTIRSGYDYVPETVSYRVANIDVCMERYYLMWVDRLGGVQCQPFKQNPMFKEKIARTMIKNQYGQKRLGVADITPKWELKSSWITEEEYPYYESLLVSPKVILYDTEREKCIKVNVIDTDYTEKTHKNQNGNLLNFNITVEENKNQRIIH